MKPTNKQIKELWEWCGLEYEATKLNGHPAWSIYGDDRKWCETHYIEEMGESINLTNLFKYAVPKLQEMDYATLLRDSQGDSPYHAEIYLYGDKGESVFKGAVNDDPALALFWAIREVLSP